MYQFQNKKNKQTKLNKTKQYKTALTNKQTKKKKNKNKKYNRLRAAPGLVKRKHVGAWNRNARVDTTRVLTFSLESVPGVTAFSIILMLYSPRFPVNITFQGTAAKLSYFFFRVLFV